MVLESQLKAEKKNSVYNDEIGNYYQQIQILSQRCLNLEHLILFGDITSVPHVVHDFKAMSQFYLPQLAKEIEIYRFCPEERAEVLDFLKYLRSVTQEIEDMVFDTHE